MSESKTGRKAAQAAAAMNATAKVVITDEKYVKNLRDDLANGRYVAQEGARALLREYDRLLAVYTENIQTYETLEEKHKKCVFDNVDLQEKLGSALMRNEDLTQNLDVARVRALDADNYGADLSKLAKFIIEEVPGETNKSEGAIDTAIRLIKFLTEREEQSRREAEQSSNEEHRYAQELVESEKQREQYGSQLDELAAFIIREVPGEPAESLGAVQTAIKIIRGYLTKDKRNIELAAAAPFADEVVAIGTTRADMMLGVDLANGEDRSVVVETNASRERLRALTQKYDEAKAAESSLAPAEQGKDSIGD